MSSPRPLAADLVLDCARVNLDATHIAPLRERLQAGNIDWAQVLEIANDHGVMPLVFKALDRAGIDAVPQPHRDALRQKARENAGQNMLLMRELLSLLGTMTAAGLRPLPYKGPLLAQLAYGDLSLRKAGDLDILVPEADLPAARAVVANAGYEFKADLAAQDEVAHMASPHEYDFVYIHPKTKVMIEMHWQVAGRAFSFQPDPVQLWERGNWQNIGSTKLRMLSDEDLLLILCAHGTKHFWTRLTWICDIAQFLNTHTSLDWEMLNRRAIELDARGMVQLAILLAQRLLNIAVPQNLLAEVRPAIHSQAAKLDHRLFLTSAERDLMPKGGRAQLTDGGLLESLLFQCRTRESWGSAFRYFFHRGFSPTINDRAAMPLPRGLGFIHYVLRPLRLLRKYSPLRSRREA